MENENRKVLVSFKVSTLVLVIIAIITIGIITAVVVKNIPAKSELASTVSTFEEQEIENDEINNEENNSEEKVIKAQITSRSSEPRSNKEIEKIDSLQNVGIINETIENSIIEEVEQPVVETIENPTTKIEDVKISRDMNLTERTGLSKEDFITLIAGVEEDKSNFFEENAGLIYDMCEKYQLNEIFFCGLISAESGWNIAGNHRRTHNYISLMSKNGLIKYDSVEQGLEKAAQVLHDNYLTEGGKFYYGPTLSGMKTRFCPASSTWVDLVFGRMKQVLD